MQSGRRYDGFIGITARKFSKLILLLSAFLSIINPALTSGLFVGTREISINMDSLDILLSDKVIDGCMVRPKSIENAAELIIKRNGLRVSEEARTLFFIELLVFQADNKAGNRIGCVASINIEVLYRTNFGPILIYRFTDLMIGGDEKTDDLKSSVNEAVEDFVVNLLRKRDEASPSEPNTDTLSPRSGTSHRS